MSDNRRWRTCLLSQKLIVQARIRQTWIKILSYSLLPGATNVEMFLSWQTFQLPARCFVKVVWYGSLPLDHQQRTTVAVSAAAPAFHPIVRLLSWWCTVHGRMDRWTNSFPIRHVILTQTRANSATAEGTSGGKNQEPSSEPLKQDIVVTSVYTYLISPSRNKMFIMLLRRRATKLHRLPRRKWWDPEARGPGMELSK